MALPYTYCTRIGLGFLAEACGKRGPASNTATDARAIGDDVAEFSGGRPNRASLVFGRSMLRLNDCLFRLGDIGLGPCREQNQSAWQAEAPAPPWKDGHQQAATDVLGVRIRDPKFSSAPLHVLVIASGYRRLEAQRTEASDQVLPFDWTNGRHSSDFADLKALAVNVRNRGVIGNAEEHPSLQHTLQLLPAGFEGLGICPDARDGRNVAIERPVILYNLVAGLAHGRPDIRSEHASVSHQRCRGSTAAVRKTH